MRRSFAESASPTLAELLAICAEGKPKRILRREHAAIGPTLGSRFCRLRCCAESLACVPGCHCHAITR